MFTLTGSGILNILFDARLRNPAQLPAQLTFCPAQFASKKAYNFHFFPHPVRRPVYFNTFLNTKMTFEKTVHSEVFLSMLQC